MISFACTKYQNLVQNQIGPDRRRRSKTLVRKCFATIKHQLNQLSWSDLFSPTQTGVNRLVQGSQTISPIKIRLNEISSPHKLNSSKKSIEISKRITDEVHFPSNVEKLVFWKTFWQFFFVFKPVTVNSEQFVIW